MGYLNKAYFNKLRDNLHAYALKRREVINQTGDALHHAKRAIFSLHRDDQKEAEGKLAAAKSILDQINKKYNKDLKILDEGSYKAALEEYVEAFLFYQFITKGKIDKIDLPVEDDVYLAGLCDVPGELQRYAVKAATKRDEATVQKCAVAAEEIIGELIEFDLTSYLRTKFDQAKQALRKIEEVVYELSLKK
jgi:translin